MSKMKKIIMIGLIICLLIAIGIEVKATSDNPFDLEDETPLEMESSTNKAKEANAIYANQQAANAQAGSVIQPNVEGNGTGNTLPKTGVTEDITVMFFIIVCVISAIYAYKKIRDYNV